jgi:hypothetical protein
LNDFARVKPSSVQSDVSRKDPVNLRRAQRADWDRMLSLQEANLVWNLDEGQRSRGFLSARFSGEDFRAMNDSGAVVVAQDGDALAGYACASSREFNANVPIIAAMMQELGRLSFLGRALHTPATIIYGPVCVDHAYRGKGVFRGLIGALKQELRGRFESAVGFIAKSNPRSLAAHVDGLGMSIVGEFRHAGAPLWIVAFGIPPEAIACHL